MAFWLTESILVSKLKNMDHHYPFLAMATIISLGKI